MINTLKHAALPVTAIIMVATPARSQAPTDAQRSAIRSQCSADYQAHCASAAGRRGFAAVPAEKHVEPFIRLPGRGDAGGLDFAGVQGRIDPVRRAVGAMAPLSACQIKQAKSYSPRNARINWINRTDSAT